MIWDSTLIMAMFGVVIASGTFTVLYVSFRHRATISRMQVNRSVYSIATGTCIIAALYLADFYVMLVLPYHTTTAAAMAAMRHLHLNWSWIVVLTGLSFIVAGLIPMLAKLFPRIEGIINSLEVEVTERKHTEKAVRESEERYRFLYGSIPLAVWEEDWSQVRKMVDRLSDDGVTDWAAYFDSHPEEVKRAYDLCETLSPNPAALDMYRTQSREAVLESVSSTSLTAAELYSFTGWVAAFARGETTFVTESRETRADDSSFDAHIRSHIPPECVDDWGRVITTIEDITERKRLESELLRQGRLATLGQLTATVSHELRNPLGVIRTSTFLLRNSLKEEMPRAHRALERVERSVTRCDRIIEELLDFTRMSNFEPEPTSIDSWLGGVLAEQMLPAGISLRRDFDLFQVKVPLDRDRFRRAVINVLDNACQAMLGDGEAEADVEPAERLLTVHTRTRAARIEVVFEDQGPGIPSHVYERIFEPLYSTKGFGVGLGLPVVKQIMEQHGGGIEVETEVGCGTTVRLWLDPGVDTKGAAA